MGHRSGASSIPDGGTPADTVAVLGVARRPLGRLERFDANFFGIPAHEAASMDSRQRLVLELSWEVLEDAGIVPETLRNSRTGVFLGTFPGDRARTPAGSPAGTIARRVSSFLGLRGPSFTIDSGESSAALAMRMAVESLRGGSALAIVGGVSTDDCTLVLLKPLAQALRDKNAIHRVVKGRADAGWFGSQDTGTKAVPASAPACDPAGTAANHLPSTVNWVLTAKGHVPLRLQADRLHRWLADRPGADLGAVASTLAEARTEFEYRAVVRGADREDLLAGLKALGAGRPAANVVRGKACRRRTTAFLFSGQGTQRPGMGRALYAAFPRFARAIGEMSELFDARLDRPLRDLVAAETDQDPALLDRTEYAQPALFAFEVACHRLLQSWGLEPDYVMGQSLGEVAAAHVAGVISLPDACDLVVARGRAMQAVRARGAMAALQGSEAQVSALLADGYLDRADLAAVNGPRSVVVSGDDDAVEEIVERWRADGRKARRLPVSQAFHSRHMDEALDDFGAAIRHLGFSPPTTPLVCALTGTPAGPGLLDAEYWVAQIRHAVRFQDGLRTLAQAGVDTCLEVGPAAVLSRPARGVLGEKPEGSCRGLVVVPICRSGHDEAQTLVSAVASLYVSGVPVCWRPGLTGGVAGSRERLPPYAFHRRTCQSPGVLPNRRAEGR